MRNYGVGGNFAIEYKKIIQKSYKQKRKPRKFEVFLGFGWGSRIRTYGIPESESGALPLGDTPLYNADCSASFGWDRWIRTIGMTESKSAALPLGYIPISIHHSNSYISLPQQPFFVKGFQVSFSNKSERFFTNHL